MIGWHGAALVPILLWCGVPAHAADIATIDCVGKLLSPTTTNSISRDFQASIERAQSGLPDLPPQAGVAADSDILAEVHRAAALCGEANGWRIAARAAAADYAMEALALPLFEARVRDDGVEPEQIANISKNLLNPGRGWEEEPPSEAQKRLRTFAVMNLRLLRVGIFLQSPQQRRDVYALASWLVVLNNAQTDFIAA